MAGKCGGRRLQRGQWYAAQAGHKIGDEAELDSAVPDKQQVVQVDDPAGGQAKETPQFDRVHETAAHVDETQHEVRRARQRRAVRERQDFGHQRRFRAIALPREGELHDLQRFFGTVGGRGHTGQLGGPAAQDRPPGGIG